MDQFQRLVDFVKSLETDFQKFYEKGQAAAGTRVRKGLSDLRRLAQEIRNDIQSIKMKRKEEKKKSE
ncbi:MAG: histone H1 [Ignavibacterium sp.]|nr:histone H1 [Ignavibacterium sp.]MCX7612576.1 histone H1 [Ignavibacterium sp.]MDW8376197.1 histone H1 [Ignavibacteriales bacterium]